MDPFDTIHDTVILGEGLGAITAALQLRAAGGDPLLVLPRGNLAWECGLAHCPEAGRAEDPVWTSILDDLAVDGLIDPPAVQALLAERLRDAGVAVVEAALPLAVDLDAAGLIRALLVATKQGEHLLRAGRWIDATERGALARLAGCAATPKAPSELRAWVACYRDQGFAELPAIRTTARPGEGLLGFAPDRAEAPWADLPALLDAEPLLAQEAIVGRCSFRALPSYAAGSAPQDVPANCALAAPALVAGGISGLGERSALGAAAARAVTALPAANAAAATRPALPAFTAEDADVVVAGIGTGGSFAALSAAEHGARVVAIEPQAFPGGIGTGGGISGYYYGLPAGRQRAIDDAVAALMDRYPGAFGRKAHHHFHPLAKTIVLDQVLREAGVDARYGTLVAALEVADGRVRSAVVTDGEIATRVTAPCWVDCTGDGDLCLRAGAEALHGRAGDQLYHAYTQTSAELRRDGEQRIVLGHLNRDAGWCDPGDPGDLARARIVGLAQFAPRCRDAARRPLLLFPTLGLRQAGQVVTDVTVTLDDLLSARRFGDEIGFACANVDNHATDMHHESDESVFWNWAARNWAVTAICAVPYGALLPVGLDNCWISSRCLGVTQDAHYAIRMQRDIQRVGEVVGAATAIAARDGRASRALPLAEIFAALGEDAPRPPDDLGRFSNLDQVYSLELAPVSERIAAGLDAIDRAAGGRDLWWLYRERERCETAVRQRLASDDVHASWFAATLLAAWGEDAAQPRLLRAVSEREWGFDERTAEQLRGKVRGRSPDPTGTNRLVPNWLTAVTLLRTCGDATAMPALRELAAACDHLLQVRCAIALTAAAICRRDPAARAQAAALAERLAAGPIPAVVHDPQLGLGALAQRALDGETLPADDGTDRAEDHRWQLDLAIAKLRVAAGLDASLEGLVSDPRASVRRAAAGVAVPVGV